MMVIVTNSLVGNGFAYAVGDEVSEDEFSKNVGEGWKSLCAPLEMAVKASAPETAVKHRRRSK